MAWPPDATPLFKLYAAREGRRLDHADPVADQRRTLAYLLRRAAETRFGRDHGFNRLDGVEAFQGAVPLRRYEDFWPAYGAPHFPLLNNVIWPGRIPFFAVSSGTTSGETKYLPVSREMVASNKRAALLTLVHELRCHRDARPLAGKTFMLGGSTALERLAPGVHAGDLSGIAAHTTPLWARPYSFPPEHLALEADWQRKIDGLAGAAPKHRIAAISGVPSWVQLLFERMAELHGIDVEAAVPRLMPALRLYIHGGVAFAPYRPRFDTLLAGNGARTREVYPASEGFIAIQDGDSGAGLRLITDNGLFFEFIPTAQLDCANPTRHWLATAETGVDYAIALSSNAGLFAFVLGDTVRFVSKQPPRILVTGRTSWTLSAFGEHVIGEELVTAVTAAAAAAGIEITEFTVAPVFPGAGEGRGRHRFVLETAAEPSTDLEAKLGRTVDDTLSRENEDYRVHRRGDVQLAAPEIVLVPPGRFTAWMARRGKLGGQHKVPRVLDDAAELRGLIDG